MAKPLEKPTRPDLYEEDFFAWTQEQAAKLRGRAHNDIDWDNLAEEIDSVGRSQKREIRSRLIKLLAHLLKWEHQPERRSMSWQTTIGEMRTHIDGLIEDSPSLAAFPESVIDQAYATARREAAEEMRRDLRTLPDRCPYDVRDSLDYGFMPGRPWSPDDLVLD
ncbi:DUF29 domain-containing protein [Chthonobacter rhizosphaerae]|uniref:DUF29 domain-containing protein n=1 Tax=Chthonobacter rhizosphaerae TaxID=2735553 RepID=UPI0015EF4571|nr:DUF29 domain-containing protein [Chthonobacter rhizosphaerae]